MMYILWAILESLSLSLMHSNSAPVLYCEHTSFLTPIRTSPVFLLSLPFPVMYSLLHSKPLRLACTVPRYYSYHLCLWLQCYVLSHCWQQSKWTSFSLDKGIYLKHDSQYLLLNLKDKKEWVDTAMLWPQIRKYKLEVIERFHFLFFFSLSVLNVPLFSHLTTWPTKEPGWVWRLTAVPVLVGNVASTW